MCKKLNAQETGENNTEGNVNAMTPQPPNIGTSSSTSFKPPEDRSNTPTPPLPGSGDTQSQIFLEEGYKSKPSMEGYDAVEGLSMPVNIQFEQARVGEEEENDSKWDWDEFILDLDLWNGTLWE